jgi:signal transduction histidine kinase
MTADVLGPAEAGPVTSRSRWYWRNWPVVVKLTAVLLVPSIVALVAGVLRIVDQADAGPGYARISQVARVQQQLSDLIGAVQQERDLATAFVAKGRAGDPRPLNLQFRAVDSTSQAVTTASDQVVGLQSTGYRATLARLSALGPLRASVTTGFGPVEVVVTEYSATIDPLIELDAVLTRQLDDVAVTNDAAAEHALLAGREQVSRQHAIISAALYANRLTPGQIEDVRTAAVRLGIEQDAFRGALAPADRADAARVGGDAELSRQRLLQLVLNRGVAGEPLNTSPEEWDMRNAVVIGNVATVEKELRQRIDQTALALRDRVRTSAGLNSVILFFALVLSVLVGIFVTRALLRPLGVLKRTALDVADRLPEAMARIRDGDGSERVVAPVAVSTHEEIGQVARAFDEVHSQAVRLAGEQAQLRANVNDIFVNLSRRTQSLVERQLKLIDRLESGEQDPKQLDNLFQLDHLATRMRRNSENLLVLAGTDSANRSGRPVRLVDVLRAAVSEVEQYQRLVLQQPPVVLVLGRAASDLVHLLAELLDNATQFSPPDSHVMISSVFGVDGSVTIEVADRGVGMTEEELTGANERLANPPVVDASVSRRMGLFVVGRLAIRHGINVRLRRGEGGVGVWASVTMPPRLVRLVSETVDPREATVAELAAGNGSDRVEAAPLAISPTGSNDAPVVPVPGVDGEPTGAPETGAPETNGNGTRLWGRQPAPKDSPDGAKLPVRTGKRLVPAGPPPAPPGPPTSPPVDTPAGDLPSGESSSDLFRPARATVVGPVGPGHRVTLQHSTPIFDDVASAWFKEHEAIPVRWTSPLASGPVTAAREVPVTPAAVTQEAPVTQEAAVTPEPAVTPEAPTIWKAAVTGGVAVPREAPVTREVPAAPAAVGAAPLLRRQPGRALAESGDAGKLRSRVQPVSAPEPTRPAGAPTADWGTADDGWRAAEALAMPVSAELTATGLPRRQPRALLVPGAAGAAEPTEPTSVPARSAESIRGRLASYQQGIREGRQKRQNLDQETDRSHEQQDGEEETK